MEILLNFSIGMTVIGFAFIFYLTVGTLIYTVLYNLLHRFNKSNWMYPNNRSGKRALWVDFAVIFFTSLALILIYFVGMLVHHLL